MSNNLIPSSKAYSSTDANDSVRSIAARNYILGNLPKEDLTRILPKLEQVELTLGQIIYRAEDKIEHVYFPVSAMISVIAGTSRGESAEAGVIGEEGIVGLDALLGSNSSSNENIIQHPGSAMRMKTGDIRKEFKKCKPLHDLTLGFVRLMMIQISQTVLCNRLHSVEERLSRWLLLCHDRAKTDELLLTQEFLSIMLATNRPSVTSAAISLQNANLIKYVRGRINICNRRELEEYSCDCYQTVKDEYDRFQKKQPILNA